MTSAREAILQEIAKAHAAERAVPDLTLPASPGDAKAAFVAKAKASLAAVHEIAAPAEAPACIASILAAGGLAPELHIPDGSPLNALPWRLAPALRLVTAAPGGEDSAFAAADYGIAETGTLVFFSGPNRPSSWHFRPGREFVLLLRERVVPRLEDVLAAQRPIPSTLNLVTGPSRTADIEQTIELGAHGPREVHILIAG